MNAPEASSDAPATQAGEGGAAPTLALHTMRVERIDKAACERILRDHHYLSSRSRGFKSGFNYGAVIGGDIYGCIIFTPPPVPEVVRGAFGLGRNEQGGIFELSRLCLLPCVQIKGANCASRFAAAAIRLLRRDTTTRAIISYADSEFHNGTIYRALGFKYYGLTEPKMDFWIRTIDGFKKHSRGRVSGVDGEWRPRSRKHRFLKIFDPNLHVLWIEQ